MLHKLHGSIQLRATIQVAIHELALEVRQHSTVSMINSNFRQERAADLSSEVPHPRQDFGIHTTNQCQVGPVRNIRNHLPEVRRMETKHRPKVAEPLDKSMDSTIKATLLVRILCLTLTTKIQFTERTRVIKLSLQNSHHIW